MASITVLGGMFVVESPEAAWLLTQATKTGNEAVMRDFIQRALFVDNAWGKTRNRIQTSYISPIPPA